MDRLFMKSKDSAELTVEGLYKDLERRVVSSPAGQCPVDMAAAHRFGKLVYRYKQGK